MLRERGLPLIRIVLVAALFCLPLLFTYPINATDIYRYFIRGRITSVYDENPFTTPASSIEDDPFSPLAGEWADVTSPYGPLWELSAGALSQFAQDDLLTALVSFKALTALAFLAGAILIWHSSRLSRPSDRAGATLLWAWNPTLLLIFAMDGHNDSLMLLWLIAGLWLIGRDHFQSGMIVMMLAPLTKAIGLLPLPFFFIAIWSRLPDLAARVRFLLTTLVAGVALIVLFFLPFGSPLYLGRRLIDEAEGGLGFSLTTLLYMLSADIVGYAPQIALVSRSLAVLFALFTLWLLWTTWRGRSPLRAAADIFWGYIVQALSFRIWYASWSLPWLILDHGDSEDRDAASTSRLGAGLAFLLTTQLSVVIYGHVRISLLGRSTLASHIIGVPFTFLIPVMVGLLMKGHLEKDKATAEKR
jgi:hypothetical protein